MPPGLYSVAGAVRASISRVYAVWYVVLSAPAAPSLPP